MMPTILDGILFLNVYFANIGHKTVHEKMNSTSWQHNKATHIKSLIYWKLWEYFTACVNMIRLLGAMTG